MAKKTQNFDYSEISLIDYLKVVLRRKFWIIWISLIFLIFGLIFTILSPKTYESKAVLKTGEFQNESLVPSLETTETVLEKPTLIEISKLLRIKPTEKNLEKIAGNLNIKASNGLIVIKARGNSPIKAQNLAKAVSTFIIETHQKIFNQKKQFLSTRIKGLNKEIKYQEDALASAQKAIDRFKSPTNETQGRALQAYVNQETAVQKNIIDLKLKLDDLKAQSFKNRNTHFISPPLVSERKINSRLKTNLVSAGLLGIFSGIFWVFCLDWWEKNKDKLKKP